MAQHIILVVSSHSDPVVQEFLEYCEAQGILAIPLVTFDTVGLVLQIGDATDGWLVFRNAGGADRSINLSEIGGVWFRAMPQLPCDVPPTERAYVEAEFYSVLVSLMHVLQCPVLGRPEIPGVFPSSLTSRQLRLRAYRAGLRIDVGTAFPEPVEIPVRNLLAGIDHIESPRSRRETNDEATDTIDAYYVKCGARDGLMLRTERRHALDHSHGEEGVLGECRKAAEYMRVDTLVMSLCFGESTSVHGISQILPADLILASKDWLFSAVMGALQHE